MTVAHTGPGPVRGTDPREAARVMLGECHTMPVVPELADRGPGADRVGRTAAMLTDLPVDVSPRGWRLADAPGRFARRAADVLDRDLDAVEEADEAVRDPEAPPFSPDRRLVLRVLGPWSLAARLELPGGFPVLTDRGARRDVAGALVEGIAARAVRLAGRMRTGVRVVLDEPALWHVAAGAVPTPSRFDPAPAVAPEALSLSLCRFAATLRSAGVDEVLLRVPSADGPDAVGAYWTVVTDPPRGETPLDGLCVASSLLDPALSDPAVSHAALDAAGTVLGDGGILQLEGLPGTTRLPTTGPGAEQAALPVLTLLDSLAAPRYETLPRLVLTPTVEDMTTGGLTPADVLAAVRRVAEVTPRIAE